MEPPADAEVEVLPAAAGPVRDRLRTIAFAVHALSLTCGLAILLRANRSQWFTFDEWDFLALRGLRGSQLGLFQPHSEHWSTVPILVYRLLFSVFGLHSYLPYVVVLVALHLLAAHLLFRVMLRSGSDPLVAAMLVAVLVVHGAGAENLLWAFQIGFVGSVAFGLAALLAALSDIGRLRRVGSWVLAIAALMSSGIGVTMVAVVGVAVLLRRGPGAAAEAVLPPAVVYLVWLAGPGGEGLGSHEVTVDGLYEVPAFVLTGLTGGVERTLGMPGAGAVVVLAMVAYFVARSGAARGPLGVAAACAVGAVFMLAIAGVGRVGLGTDVARSPRYTYIAIALMLPGLALLLSEAAQRRTGAHLVLAAGLAAVAIHNVGLLREEAREQFAQEDPSRRRLAAVAELIRSDAPLLDGVQPEPTWAPNLYVDAFTRMVDDGKVPTARDLGPSDLLAASTHVQLALREGRPASARAGGAIDAVADLSNAPGAGGCNDLTAAGPRPTAWVRFDAPGWASIRSVGGGALSLELADSDGAAIGPTRSFTLPPGSERWLEVSRPSSIVALHLSAGATRLCVAPPP